MTSNGTGDGWDRIVSPWHLDEHIPAWAVPAGATALIGPSLPASSQLQRMNLLHQATAEAVARAARPLLLSCDCPAAIGAVAGLQRRYDDMAVVWLDGHT
jgi:arginase